MSDIKQLPSEIITEIEMSKQNKIWLILEGLSDEKIFLARTFSESVKAVVASGWENVITIVTECDKLEDKKVIGLIDRDYRDLKEEQPIHQNIAITDFRDIENILFESSALLKVYSELGAIEKLPKNTFGQIKIGEIKELLSKVAVKLGMYRAYCYANGINVSFEKLDHAKFIDDKNLSLDVRKFINHLVGNPKNKDLVLDIDWETTQSNWMPQSIQSPVYIRHGHDLMSIIAISFKRKYGTRGGSISQKDIEAFFRIAINDEELQKYDFWKQIEGIIAS
jgi:hypothetical protein